MNAALYVRVSTPDQSPALQLQELTSYAARQGWAVVATYQDEISGAKASRPGLDALLGDALRRGFDCVLVWKLDRFGRSLVDCLNNIHELESVGGRLGAVTQVLDADHRNPGSRFMLAVLGAAAEFERSLIVEKRRAGQARYRKDYKAGKLARRCGAGRARTCAHTGGGRCSAGERWRSCGLSRFSRKWRASVPR